MGPLIGSFVEHARSRKQVDETRFYLLLTFSPAMRCVLQLIPPDCPINLRGHRIVWPKKRYADLDWALITSAAAFPRASPALIFLKRSRKLETHLSFLAVARYAAQSENRRGRGKDFNLDRRARVKAGRKSRARVLGAPALIKFLLRRCPSRRST